MTKATLIEFMATQPEIALESIAADYQVTLLEVIKALPNSVIVSGDKFDEVWQHATTWGELITVVRTNEIIMENTGILPGGFYGHGYFNLHSNGALSGHIKTEKCQAIAFIERLFRGVTMATVIFLNEQGDSIVKLFLGTHEHQEPQPEKLAAFRYLAAQLYASEHQSS